MASCRTPKRRDLGTAPGGAHRDRPPSSPDFPSRGGLEYEGGMKAIPLLGASLLAAAALTTLSSPARADLVIKNPNAHPDYRVELEPQVEMVLFHPGYGIGGYGGGRYGYGGYYGSGCSGAIGCPEFGGGFRASIKIVDPGFIPKLNNTIAITFGIDITNCQYCYAHNNGFSVWTPIGLQWNFFLTDKFSAFADLGFTLRGDGFFQSIYPDFMLELGGRYHINKNIGLTFRVGYPFVTFGPSFFI